MISIARTKNWFQALPPIWQRTAPYFILIAAVVATYANVYHNQFVFDDVAITENKFLTSWRYIGRLFSTDVSEGSGRQLQAPFYRPIMMLLYLFVYQAAGPSTVAFHLLNITLHALNACLLYTLGIRLKFHHVAGFCAALLWSLHPVQTEAVDYMTCTAEFCAAPLSSAAFLL